MSGLSDEWRGRTRDRHDYLGGNELGSSFSELLFSGLLGCEVVRIGKRTCTRGDVEKANGSYEVGQIILPGKYLGAFSTGYA